MLIGYLQDEYDRRKAKNPRYSLRAFAKSLGIDSSTLMRLLARKRKLSAVQAVKMVSALDIDQALRSTLLLGHLGGDTRPIPRDEDYTEAALEAKGMEYWEFFAVLSLLELKSTKHSLSWIAETLGSTRERIATCIASLEEQKYVKKVGSRWTIQGAQLTTPRGCGKWAVVNAQSEYLKKADETLWRREKESDFSGSTMAIDSKKLPEAMRRIKEFRRSLASFVAQEPNDRIYRLNIQLFPLDRAPKKTKNKVPRSE